MAAKKEVYRIQFFNSLEEENEATAKYRAERTPIESLQAAHLIITAMYREELENSDTKYDRITFVDPTDYYSQVEGV